MDATAESGRNPMSRPQIQPECEEKAGSRGTGRPNSSREAKFLGVNGDRKSHFPRSADHELDWQPYPVYLYSTIINDYHTQERHLRHRWLSTTTWESKQQDGTQDGQDYCCNCDTDMERV